MRELPRGTVTLLFTDMEGSTRLLQQVGERYTVLSMQKRCANQGRIPQREVQHRIDARQPVNALKSTFGLMLLVPSLSHERIDGVLSVSLHRIGW